MTKQFKGMYIGGKWVDIDRTFNDMNPSDDSVWAQVADGGVAETKAAYKCGARSFR